LFTTLKEFASIEEAAEFWDTHSLADYWDETHEVEVVVRTSPRQWIPLAANLATKVTEQARQEGVSIESLINLWVAEKVQSSP
jgi:hypothetical protein